MKHIFFLKTKLIDTKNRLAVARVKESGVAEVGEGNPKVYTSYYIKKMSHGDVIYSMVTGVNNTVLYI